MLGQSFGLTIVEQSAGRLLWTYVTLAVIAIVAESVIAGVLSARAGKTDIEKDERDLAIEVKANLASYWFTAAALNVIVIHVLANAAYGGHDLPKLNLTSLTGVAFALLLVLTLAEIVKRVAVIWNYRARMSPRKGRVANHIRTCAIARGLSQGALAEQVGATRQTINAIEQEKYAPSLELAFRIALAFEVGVRGSLGVRRIA